MQLKDYVPFFISKIKDIEQIYKAQGKELNKIKLDIKDLCDQCFVATATWGLDYWELILNIETDTSKSIQERRSNIFAKLRGQGTTTIEVIRDIAQAYFNTDKVEVIENASHYEFTISVAWNKDSKFLDLENSINEVKPAHLNFKFAIEKETFIDIQTKFKVYPFKLNMCGTFNSGTIPEYSNKGITIHEHININSNNQNWDQKYKMCGGKEI